MVCFIGLSVVFFVLFPRILARFRKGVIEVACFSESLCFIHKIAVGALYLRKPFLERAMMALSCVTLYFIGDVDKLEEGIFETLEVFPIAVYEDILA